MSLLEAPWVISFTFALLAFSLPTNGFLTGLLNSTNHVSPSAGKIPVSDAPFLNANVTNPALATMLSEESVASVHETACPSAVAAIASASSTVICTSPISIPGLTFPSCNTYTTYHFPKSVYPPASCCNTCSIQASRVQVNYWAPEANSTTQVPKIPYTLVSDGYTFTSPSVYVVYKDLYAQGDCTYYEQGQIGNNISDATIAYDPEALSTAPCVQSGETEFIGYQPINYLDWYNHIPNSVEENQPGCDIPNTHGINPAGTDLAANPMFSLPPGLSSLEPIWSSYACQPNGRYPGFDPPRVLTKTSAFAPGIQHPATQLAAPTPAAKLSPPIVAPTTANNAQPTPEAGIPDPKSVNADPKAGGLIPGAATSDPHPTPTSQDADPLDDDPAPAVNLPAAGKSASVEVAGQPLLNSDPANQGLGPGSSQNIGEDPPNAAPAPKQAFTVGNEVVTANSASQYVVNGQTITPGAPAVFISGTPISLGPSARNVVIGTNTIPLGELSPSALPSFTIGNEVVTANSASQYVVSGQTITPGAPAVIISGTPISLDPSTRNVVIGTNTIPLEQPSPSALPSFTFEKKVITADSASNYVVDGQTITPGAPAITISGTPISLDPSTKNVVIGTNTIPLEQPPPLPLPSFTIGNQLLTADSASHYIINSQTLTPGAPAITISGTPISLAPSSSYIAIGSTTIPLLDATTTPSPPTIVINGQTITANSASQFLIDGYTLTPGAPVVTIDGTPVSVPANAQPLLTIPSQAYSVDAAGDIVIASQTLVPGGAAVTLAGETVSEAADRSDVVVASGGVVATEGLAKFIAGALGKAAVSTGGVVGGGNGSFDGVQTFTGGARKGKGGMGLFGVMGVMVVLAAVRGEVG